MDPDLLTVGPADLTRLVGVSSMGVSHEESSDVVGLHVLTAGSHMGGDMMEDLQDVHQGSMSVASGISDAVMNKEGELTFNSSFMPENTILLETPRGLMLTVSDSISNLTYNEDNSPQDVNSRQLISCIPVSLYSTDVDNSAVFVDNSMAEDVKPMTLTYTEVGDVSLSHGLAGEPGDSGDLPSDLPLDPSLDGLEPQLTQKRKGGWPKGKKRKKTPVITGPRAPLTGYVLYAMDRRREIKVSHPHILFPEVTKILGQEWSAMDHDIKEKYLAAADLDKKRYREELKALKSTDTYQETVRKKMCMVNNGNLQSDVDPSACVEDEDDTDELHCKVCDIYFSSLHNKKEHIHGNRHIQAVAGAVEKELLLRQAEEAALMEGSMEGALVKGNKKYQY